MITREGVKIKDRYNTVMSSKVDEMFYTTILLNPHPVSHPKLVKKSASVRINRANRCSSKPT